MTPKPLQLIRNVKSLYVLDKTGKSLILAIKRRIFSSDLTWKPNHYFVEKLPRTADLQRVIGFFIHIHYLDYAIRLTDHLDAGPGLGKVYVTTSVVEVALHLEDWNEKTGYRITVIFTPNRGRNFGPLLVSLREELASFDFIVHLHSKKSPHSRASHANDWSDRFWNLLLLDEQLLRRCLSIMGSNENIGIISPLLSDLIDPRAFSWTNNEISARSIARKLGFESLPSRFGYPAGGMFLARTEAISPLIAYEWNWSDFPTEKGQLDGTTQHAVERFIGFVSVSQGFENLYYDFETDLFTLDETFVTSDGEESLTWSL